MVTSATPLHEIGERLFDRFRIDASFAGGLGVLYAVTDTHTGRHYAAKTVREGFRDDEAIVAAFRHEAETWIHLDRHDHLVQAFWLVEAEPVPYLFLEWIDGTDLARLLEDGPLPVERAVDLAMQCASGLAYAHGKAVPGGVGVVHRDVKPSNLLVDRAGRLHVSDFGLARIARPRDPADATTPPRGGTPAYMAPEQIRGDAAIDGRADVYGFGLVLYEMLTGANPLAAADLPTQVERTLHEVPPPLTGVPPGLAALVGRCVAKDPADRPRDFREVLAHLAQEARALTYEWAIDPAGIAPPSVAVGIVVDAPVLRPRRPRAGLPVTIEIAVRGDIGPGPVALSWTLPAARGLTVLSPGGTARLLVEAGGRVDLRLRLDVVAAAEGRVPLPDSAIVAEGPQGARRYPVPAHALDVAFAFVLPFVDREAEAAFLEDAFDGLRAGRPGAVFFRAGVGGGRSRMLQEAARIGAERGVRTIATQADRSGLRPLRVLHDLARRLLDVGAEEGQAIRAAVHALLGDRPDTARYFAEVLLGVDMPDHAAPPAHHWYALLRGVAKREPLALLLDDLHYAAEEGVRILLDAAGRAHADGVPLLVAGTFGEIPDDATVRRRVRAFEQAFEAAAVPGARIFPLAPLARAHVAELVDAVFPGHGFAQEAPWLLDTIARVTAGNPFHVAEILRALRLGEEGAVVRRDDEWRVRDDLTPEALRSLVPTALGAAVTRRLQTLSRNARALFYVAALVGDQFDAAVLREAVRDDDRVERGLAELEEAGVVRVTDPDLDRYRIWSPVVVNFVQKLVRDGPPERRRRLHAAVARGMLATYRGDALRRRALGLARHLRNADQPVHSLRFTLAGCQRLLGLHLPERARRLLLNAEPIAAGPEIPDEQKARFDYLYGIACESTGDFENGRTALERFLARGEDLPDDPRSLARSYARLGRIFMAWGEAGRARELFHRARARLDEREDRRAVAFVLCSLAELELGQGQVRDARAYLDEARTIAQDTGNAGAEIQVDTLAGRLELAMDEPEGARRRFRRACDAARELGDRRRLASALEGLGTAALRSGYLAEAQRLFEEALDVSARMGERPRLADGLLRLGEVFEALGRGDRALHHYRRAQRVFQEVGRREGVAVAQHHAGRLLQRRGKTANALRDLAAAAEGLAALRLPGRAAVLRDLGATLADAGSAGPARLALARADRAEWPGPARRARRVHSRVVRVRLALAAGDLRQARVWARRALRLAARTTGHRARVAANQAAAEVALRAGDLHEARRGADTALAFARETGDVLAAAAAERALLELDARAGRRAEVRTRAHRVARAYTGRGDAGDGPARLLLALGRGPDAAAAPRYLRRARNCYARLEAQGFRPPPGL